MTSGSQGQAAKGHGRQRRQPAAAAQPLGDIGCEHHEQHDHHQVCP